MAGLTLALGIGVNTAAFSVVNAVIMRPLPFPNPGRLMAILSTNPATKESFGSAQGVYVDWRERSTSFETIVGARPTRMLWSGVGQPRFLSIAAASFDFLPLIGAHAILGRTFTKAEDQPGQADVALLDAGFWKRELGGKTDVLGRTIMLDDKPYNIVGILPAGIHFGYFGAIDVWIPMAANRDFRTGGDVIAVGRLRSGVKREAAQAEMEIVMRGIGRDHVEDFNTGVLVKPLHDWVVGNVRRTLLMLLGAVIFILLICCANIANLLLARSTARQQEMAIRASLGAGRARLVRQALVESILLASFGGALGLGVAVAVVRVVPSIRVFYIPRLEEIAVDHTLLMIAVLLSAATGIAFGLAPALQIRRREDLGTALHQDTRSASGSAGARHIRNALVVAQLALALVLLSGAGLMTNSLLQLLRINLGFERANLLTVNILLPYKRYDHNRTVEFERRLLSEVSRMPGVEQVSASDHLPLQAVLLPIHVRAQNAGVKGCCEAFARYVTTGYLRVMGIPLLAGRDLQDADDEKKPPEIPIRVLISKKAAVLLFGSSDPIGKHLTTDYAQLKTLEIIGVVGDTHQFGLTEEPGPQLYLPLAYRGFQYIVARTARNAGDLTGGIRAAVRALDPEVPAPQTNTMNAIFSDAVAKPRFYLLLLGAFASAGVILAAIGTYGVMAYNIRLRMHEFGVRIALGAEPRDILTLVLGAGMRLTSAGIVLGLAGSLAFTRFLSGVLYGVHPTDPLTFGCVVVLLGGISLLACYVASKSATTVDPNVALRCE